MAPGPGQIAAWPLRPAGPARFGARSGGTGVGGRGHVLRAMGEPASTAGTKPALRGRGAQTKGAGEPRPRPSERVSCGCLPSPGAAGTLRAAIRLFRRDPPGEPRQRITRMKIKFSFYKKEEEEKGAREIKLGKRKRGETGPFSSRRGAASMWRRAGWRERAARAAGCRGRPGAAGAGPARCAFTRGRAQSRAPPTRPAPPAGTSAP